MSFYSEKILPKLVESICSGKHFMQLRKQKLSKLHGVGLELGCGVGLNFSFYSNTVKKLFVIEPCAVSREKAQQVANSLKLDVIFLDYDEHGKIPLADNSLDFVCSTWTMCTISDLPKSLLDVKRLLKNDGELHFLEHGLSPDHLTAVAQNVLNPLQKFIGGGCHLNRKIDDFIIESGMEITELSNFYMPGIRVGSYVYSGVAKTP